MNKRYDIQWLRTLSIVCVLLFHLWPALFPAGFLGVDMFFVISGYLMTRILNKDFKNDKPMADLVMNFYTRRIKRIFPMYYLTIFWTLLMTFYCLTPMDAVFVQKEARWAILMAMNMKSVFRNENYFALQSANDYLLHTWSLGMEVQYYVFAPFLLRWISKQRNPLLATGQVVMGSVLFQHLLSSTTLFFDFLPCRLWQFLVGTLVFYIGDNDSFLPICCRDFKSVFTALAALGLGARVLIMPYGGMQSFWQLLATFGAGLVLVAGAHWQPDHSKVSHRFMTLFGDASYSLYLLHWPLITLSKHTHYLEIFWFIPLMFFILFISLIQYQLVEKKISQMPGTFLGPVIVFLVFVTGIMAVMPRTSFVDGLKVPMHVPEDITREEAIYLNQRIAYEVDKLPDSCRPDPLLEAAFPDYEALLDMDGMCSVVFNGTTGNKTAVVLGNSFAVVQLGSILDALQELPIGKELKKVYLIGRAGCVPLPSLKKFNRREDKCDNITEQVLPLLKNIKPEVVIFSARISHLPDYHRLPVSKNDNVTANITADFRAITGNSKGVVVIQPNPIISEEKTNPFSLKLAHYLQIGRFLTFLDVDNMMTAGDYFIPNMRLVAALEKCEKCHLVNVIDKFCNETVCHTFDRVTNVSYYGDNQHLSRVGIGLFYDELRDTIASVLGSPATTPASTAATDGSSTTTNLPKSKRAKNTRHRIEQ